MLDQAAHPMVDDLRKSGLIPDDIHARPIDSSERAATNIPHSTKGYVIPFQDLHGRPLPYYRVRAFDFVPKYKVPKESANHVYFPPRFLETSKKLPFILVTEGEKKAALATKLGFAAVGLAGVDSWRNRMVVLPLAAELSQNESKGILKAKLPPQTEMSEDTAQNLATGMQELIDYALMNNKTIIICYDSDQVVGVKPSVQRAAASFGFELRFRGIAFGKIRQIVLPPLRQTSDLGKNIEHAQEETKVALDDYLLEKGPKAFQELIEVCMNKRSAFPRHPSIRDFINKKLQRGMIPRKDMQALAIAVLSDLDANGMRIRTEGGDHFYFDFVTRKLLKTTFDMRAESIAGSAFGQFIYRRYGLGGADQRLLIWIATQFAGEDPIEEVQPYSILARSRTSEDSVTYQVSDSQYVRIDRDGLELYDNGEGGVLFVSGNVEAIDTEKLLIYTERERAKGKPENWWGDVLSHVRLKDQDKGRIITSLLYYMSPWLYKWRGMQLPVEMVIGESGSGKSTLCELRLGVLTGIAKLRNAPSDLKDWHASISNSGGLHVTDNVKLVDPSLRQKLSDEICRIITEPNPSIEQRKYYTNSELVRIPVRAVFAVTAIQQPFQNADLLQRSIILELDKTAGSDDGRPEIEYDSEWMRHQLERYDGREGWIAHHADVLRRFFLLVNEKWNPKYKAKHRLIHFEQTMMLMAQVFGLDSSWIPKFLAGIVDKTLEETDWTFEGIRAFVDKMGSYYYNNDKFVTCQDIAEWCLQEEDFKGCDMLINSRRLARYMQTHKSIIAISCCLVDKGKRNNRQVFKVVAPKKKE